MKHYKLDTFKALIILTMPILWIKFFEKPWGFTWWRIFLLIIAIIASILFAIQENKEGAKC